MYDVCPVKFQHFNFADHDSEEWSGTKSYVAVIVTVASLVSIFVFLIVCAFLCPRRRGGDSSRTMVFTNFIFLFFPEFLTN